MPVLSSRVVNTAALGAKMLQLAPWSTVPRCSCLFSTAHPHNETAPLRQFALTQHSGGTCRCSSCTSKHWRKWANASPQESNSRIDEICIMFLSRYLLRLQVCLMSTCIQMCLFCSWGRAKLICWCRLVKVVPWCVPVYSHLDHYWISFFSLFYMAVIVTKLVLSIHNKNVLVWFRPASLCVGFVGSSLWLHDVL